MSDTPSPISDHDKRLAQELLATADSLAYCVGCAEEINAQHHRAATAAQAMTDLLILRGPLVARALRLLAVCLDGNALKL
jgi:hypothetical protein